MNAEQMTYEELENALADANEDEITKILKQLQILDDKEIFVSEKTKAAETKYWLLFNDLSKVNEALVNDQDDFENTMDSDENIERDSLEFWEKMIGSLCVCAEDRAIELELDEQNMLKVQTILGDRK